MASKVGCAILDANVLNEVFGDTQHEAGRGFRKAITAGKIRLLSGGKLHKELLKSAEFRSWASVAQTTYSLMILGEERLKEAVAKYEQHHERKSDDPHVLAIAYVGRARFLYSNDKLLHGDFKNPSLLPSPRGIVYSTLKGKQAKRGAMTYEPDHDAKFTSHRKRLIAKAPACAE